MVTPCYYTAKGGTETIVRNLSILLNRKKIHTDVMAFNMDRKWHPKWQGKIEKIDGITVFRIPAINWLPISHSDRITLGVNLLPGKFTNILKHYDVIHFHELDLSFPLFSSLIRKPRIIHLHGIDISFFRRYHLSRILLKQLANLYISISKQMKKDLTTLGIPESQISYVPNGVDINTFLPSGPKEENLLLFVGRITFGKGLHILLKSLSYLKKSVRLIIIGPPDWDLKYYQNILKMIEEINQKGIHQINYLGTLDQADIIKWYQKASMFILPSFAEGFPVTALEALSCETPVIATPVGGIPDAVKNYGNGILVPVDNAPKFAEAIQYLLDNEKVRTKFGREGRKRVIANFSLETMARNITKIYEQLTDSQGPISINCP